jgi:hypothetical protein
MLLILESVIYNEVFKKQFPATWSVCSLLDASDRFIPRDVILCFGKIKLGGALQLTRCSVIVDMHSASGNQYMALFLQPLHGYMLTEVFTRPTCYRQYGYVPTNMFLNMQ